VDPETQRFDREAMHAHRRAVIARVQHETDEIVAAAFAKRRAFDEWQLLRMRSVAEAEKKRLRVLAGTDTDAAPGVTDDRLRAALQRSKVVRRDVSVPEPVSLPWAATG
jgi:hypothetical protein